jgi:serine/threonine protein phosphatase PrpC
MTVLSSGATDIGRKRKTNQDSICVAPDLYFFAVADGMGGHNGGDIASQLSVKLMPEYIRSNKDLEPKVLLKNCIEHVCKEIYKKSEVSPELKGMGTTVVSYMFKGSQIFIGNVGDSRTYLVSNNQLFQLTKDHSFVQEKLNMGLYNREQAALDKQKNVLVRTVGFEPEVEVDVFSYKVCKNDLFFCCSDGLHGKVSDKDILYIIQKYIPSPGIASKEDIDTTVRALIQQANDNGGQDNISVVMAIAK